MDLHVKNVWTTLVTCLDIILPLGSKSSSKCKCLHKWGRISLPSHSTHTAYFWTLLAYMCHPLFPTLFQRGIGIATLARPHSYSLPLLVIGLTHQAPTRSPPTVSMFGHFRVYPRPTLALCAFISRAHTHTVRMQMAPWKVHKEEAGFNWQSGAVNSSGSSGKLSLHE